MLYTISNVFEKLVAKQIIDHFNNSPFQLHPMQFSFSINHSTETATCYFIEKVKALMDKGGEVGTVFLDLQKASDTVIHNILLHKLLNLNFSTNSIHLIES